MDRREAHTPGGRDGQTPPQRQKGLPRITMEEPTPDYSIQIDRENSTDIRNHPNRPQRQVSMDTEVPYRNGPGYGQADMDQIQTQFPGVWINPQDYTATMIRRRRTSSKKRKEDFQYLEGEDDGTLPSHRMLRHSRTKTIKERKQDMAQEELQQAHKPKTLKERYAELKEKEDLSAGALATLMRDSTLTRMKDWQQPKSWTKFKRKSHDVFQRLAIWDGTFRVVEGKFGTAVMSYFRFIKWLMFLNLYIMLITFCVIMVPYLVLQQRDFPESVNTTTSVLHEHAVVCSEEYRNYTADTLAKESTFEKVLDFLQGKGWMERTVLFYGVYYNRTYPTVDSEATYDMGLAYLLAVGACFCISFVLIVKNSAKNVKATFGKEKALALYCNKVFAGWDFCIRDGRAATCKNLSLLKDCKASLAEQQREWELEDQTFQDKCKIFSIRLFINLLVLCLLVGSMVCIYYTTVKLLEFQNQELSEIVTLIVQYLPYLTITVLNAVVPLFFQKIVLLEKYSNTTEIRITLARSVLLRLASVAVLIFTLYILLVGEFDLPEAGLSVGIGSGEVGCGNRRWAVYNTTGLSTRGNIKCWETYVGQQIYKLVFLDLLVETGIILFWEFPRRLIYSKYGESSKLIKIVGPQHFDLPQSVIDIIYSQTLCWLGMFFSPLIPVMTFMKCIIFFYVKKLTLLKNCEPEDRPTRTSRSNSLFMTVLLLSFILASIPIGYMIGTIPPSQSCGPFRVYSGTDYVMFDVLSNTIARWPPQARDVFYFFGTVGFFVPVIILLCLLMYYYWLLGQGYKKTRQLLQRQLVLDGKDKKFLLKQVNQILQHADKAASVMSTS